MPGGRGWGARARRAALRVGAGLGAALLLLWAAAFIYGSAYFALVPAAALARPVHFTFRTDCAAPPPPQLCSFPTANVSLLGDNKEQLLLSGQQYRISLELELPESPANRALGMFMVTLSCYGHRGRPLGSAARSAMLRYRSRLLRALDTAAFAGLFLAGVAEQKQTVEVELWGRYRQDPYDPAVGLVLQIQSKHIQLYSARLRVHAHFSGLRYLLFHFPLSSALLGVAGNFWLLALLALLGLLQRGRGRAPAAPQARHEAPGATRQEEDPTPPREEPEVLRPEEPEEADPPLLTAANVPPRQEEEEGGGGEGAPSPTPPPLEAGPAPPPRLRPTCSSS